MNQQKSRAALLLPCAVLSLALAGCAKKGSSAPAIEKPAPSAAVQTAAPTPAPTPTPEPPITILGTSYNKTDASVELRGLKDADVSDTAAMLRRMPDVQRLHIGSQSETPLSWDSLRLLHEAAPRAVIDYSFTMFDRQFNLSDEFMDLNYIPMEDEGALVSQVTACMTKLRRLEMDSCRVPNEAMARLRDSLPNTEVVWRINFGSGYTARTDVEKILASMPGQGGELAHNNVKNLMYCTKLKYLDLGHNNYLDTIEFCRYMPELEVLIVGMSFVEDFSPLAACPKLEYVEAMTTRLHDLTPFENLHNLRHLNICYNFAVTDITPLYGLDLDRLWIGMHDPVPKEQIEKYQELHPNCVVNATTPDPTEEYWRFADHGDEMGNQLYDPRYELLRQQMGYGEEAYAYYWTDPLYDYTCPRFVEEDPGVVDFVGLFDVY
ncbi:MAG: hypothetical protein IJQ36_03990 [Oscillospiraceae bacterium]|nr:hypothetical protein [Oscillospiraceae bacterium]